MLKLIILSILLPFALFETRPKIHDDTYAELIPITELPRSCKEYNQGYAIIRNSLEKCDQYLAEADGDNVEDGKYEDFKCTHLRVNGELTRDGKCKCKDKWKGPICNEFDGCPSGFSLYNGVCTPNPCQNNGVLSVGSKQIECRCDVPWDGRWCERLACWRMADKEHERRWRNAGKGCRCADGFEGDNCDKIVFCKNGELANGRCICIEGYKGELCERKCIPNQT